MQNKKCRITSVNAVNTNIGLLSARAYPDPEYPGIWIELHRPEQSDCIPVAKIECYNNELRLMADIYADIERDEVTDQIEISYERTDEE